MAFLLDDIVVVPTHNRPEMLALCLRRLKAARGCPEVLICADTAADLAEIEYVRDTEFPQADILHARAHISAPSGCWNILNSIKQGSRLAQNVFFVEDDVTVYPHFFEWHRAQKCEVSCGRRLTGPCERWSRRYPTAYTNPGSYLRRPVLDRLIPHINDDYFTRLREYLDEKFGKADHWTALDDGLIRRVAGDCVYPEQPVCAHQGFRNYNRIDIYMNRGTIQERIAGLERIFSSIQPGDRYAQDFEPFNPRT